MFHGKLRIHTCRVILLTSLVWFLVDVVILSFYSECLGGSCKKQPESAARIANEDYADNNPPLDDTFASEGHK
jgi:hypothetical protein